MLGGAYSGHHVFGGDRRDKIYKIYKRDEGRLIGRISILTIIRGMSVWFCAFFVGRKC